MEQGSLYIVATPIGNLKDFTQRAIDTLQMVDIIACEDTRVTQKLLNHFGINTKTMSYHKFSEKERSVRLLQILQEGKNVALVSDAGTPLISDPGSILVEEVQKQGIKVIPIPGCCALVTTLSAIANDGQFAFCGFFPQKEAEVEMYKKFAFDFDMVFYESPNRILKSLALIKKYFGDVKVSFARELTKIYEEIKTLQIDEMIEYLEKATIKGEFVLVIHKKQGAETNVEYMQYAEKLLKLGYSTKDVSKIISAIFDISKNEVYKNLNS